MSNLRKTYGSIKKKLQRLKNNMRYKHHIATNLEDKTLKRHLIEYNCQREYGCDTTICHLPMRSIYFGFDGIVTTCCFNRKHILGKFPENSVSEIIHGENRRQLQHYLDELDFSLGCQFCRDMIASGNYMSAGAIFGDHLGSNGDLPSEMVFELDNTCNLRCKMCSAKFSSAHNNGTRNIEPYDNEDFINQLKPFIPHLTETKFLGGEPFLSEIYPKIWETIIGLNPKCIIRLQTNGTILNDRIKAILEHGNFQIGISIDTLNPERYTEIRSGAKLSNTLENLEYFKAICQKNNEKLSISVCPMKENRYDMPELVDFCNKNNIFIFFNNVSTEGFSLEELSEQELAELENFYIKNIPYGNIPIFKANRDAFFGLINHVKHILARKKSVNYMNEMIPFTRIEFAQKVSGIISGKPSIELDEKIFELVPEKFNVKRRTIEKMEFMHISEFISMSEEEQLKFIRTNFITTKNDKI